MNLTVKTKLYENASLFFNRRIVFSADIRVSFNRQTKLLTYKL